MRTTIILLVLLILGTAAAQSEAKHEVSVSVPNVLKLSLDTSGNASSVHVPIRAEMQDGIATITPEMTTLYIQANSDWQLSASYQPEQGAAADLSWSLGDRESAFTSYPTILEAGSNTKGWQAKQVSYGLEASVDGVYQGVITYTLARP